MAAALMRDATDPGEERAGRFDPADASPEDRDAECVTRPQTQPPAARNKHARYASCCSAAIAPQAAQLRSNNASKINLVNGYYAILTC